MTKLISRWGATQAEWDNFDIGLGLTQDLLPVVSNPNAKISPGSDMKALGKTPSRYNAEGFVAGIPNWTEIKATPERVAKWRRQPDYGMCLQTRNVRAIDVDVKDVALAAEIAAFISERYKFPVRQRPDSAKFLLAFRCAGEMPKRVMRLSEIKGGPIIEFLGNGQQFIACGTHADGQRYAWDWQGYDDFPMISVEEFDQLWQELVGKFAVAHSSAGGLRRAKGDAAVVMMDDTVASFLSEQGLILDEGKDGQLFIECPWKDNHSTDNGVTETTYFPAGGRGYARGHFKCLHAGCLEHKDADFLEKLRFGDSLFEALPDETATMGKPKRLPLPGFARDKAGDIYTTLNNLSLALKRPDICLMSMRTDTFRDETMYAPQDDPNGWRPLRDADQVHLRQHLENNGFMPIGRELMRDAILAHADKHEFDSAIEWLSGLQWDGVERVETFLHDYFGVEDDDYSRAVSRYLWTALAGRVMEPGVKADMVPILVGAQGLGKSSGVAALVPHSDFFCEIDLKDKDDNLARLMRGKLVGEIAELRGLHTRDLESNKAFVARQFENWVPKYREFATKYPRRLIFIGTTNQEEFLADDTGNRRWLPVTVTRVRRDAIAKMRLQLWAEAREKFLGSGVDWEAEKLSAKAHDRHSIIDAWQDTIEAWLDTENDLGAEGEMSPRGRGFFTTSEVLEGAVGVLAKNCKRNDEMRVSAILRKLGFRKVRKTWEGRFQRGWEAAIIQPIQPTP